MSMIRLSLTPGLQTYVGVRTHLTSLRRRLSVIRRFRRLILWDEVHPKMDSDTALGRLRR